ncbi:MULTISPECIES: Ppx/GppA phosphatase family protein [Protofrankia]|uniref:Ppx/GppA phosphatase n=1 Tax=Candidatus Protofrankia datiscae TaxID=2716812 RepID=F8AVT6_9ACTN|nr:MULTISPECIES: Ppx/GppA phosphatase family protein [Protofrankia]AEH08274.1 Ppx/GppA phosphatase [Candidatus Protofrankia datiscae]
MTRVAAIDCGTNSIRLLVAETASGADASPTPDGRPDPVADHASGAGRASDRQAVAATPRLRDLTRRMEIVRLGAGVDRTGELSPEALERTFTALREYAAEIDRLGASRVRMVATSATRDARNRDVLVTGVRAILGVEPEVITGDEEAALSYAGATGELRGHPEPFVVADIGGGSTELVLGDAARAHAAKSVNVGCVRLAERHLHDDPPAPAQLAAVVADAHAAFDLAERTVAIRSAATLIGVAGTVTTVAALAADLPGYDPDRIHLSVTSASDVAAVADRLAAMSHAQRAALPVMHPGRVDVIVAGALVLRTLLERVGATSVIASEHDILDGIALSLLVP